MKKGLLFLGVIVLFVVQGLASSSINPASERKTLKAVRISQPPRIDGKGNDACWNNVPVAGDFVQYAPYNGSPATFPTQVKMVYDDKALYILAEMYDPHPDSIFRELGKRDADRNIRADNFSVDINPFHDGVNGVSFKVSASGVKTDMKRNPSARRGRDLNWDAVWQSSVRIHDQGWTVEMKIPYSAIRFPKSGMSAWGINFWREIRRYQEYSSWNKVDREVGNSFNYLGDLKGIRDVNPPLRLSVTPYVSGYLEKNGRTGQWSSTYNGGMDLRYGINESYTLDMTLIPDFGQVQSDDKILNLSPFEVKYNEKRQFFTEGTELFSKGDIFYSRRVGGRPKGYYKPYQELEIGEEIIDNPPETQLINATKVSGRNAKGLGVGVFNAVTKPMYARLENEETGTVRKVRTQPVTNYNLVVLDQSLKNNSYVSLVNSNVYRFASRDLYNYTANVTATDFLFKDRSNMYSVGGVGALSQKYYDTLPTVLGHRVELRAGKTGGVYQLYYKGKIISDTYDHNDMGYLRHNNVMNHEVQFGYNMYKPKKHLLSSRNSLSVEYKGLYKPAVFTGFEISMNTFNQFRNYWYTGGEISVEPLGSDDYYEPRVPGWHYHRGAEAKAYFWMMTNRNKPFSVRTRLSTGGDFTQYNRHGYGFSIMPNYKMSQRMQITYELEYSLLYNDIGYAGRNTARDSIWFGKRNGKTVTNVLTTSYIFTKNIYLSFRMRHYWSKVDYTGDYYLLQPDGSLEEASYEGTSDINYNAFTIDMDFVWRFAPGSEMSLVWKNAIYTRNSDIIPGFFENIGNVLSSPQLNSFSLKILYYLDFQRFKKNIT
jgi:hypothetical protein